MLTDPASHNDPADAKPVPLDVLFDGAITQFLRKIDGPLAEVGDIRELAKGLALIAREGDERPANVDPQKPGTITGYRTHTQDAVDAVNTIKQIENDLGAYITKLRSCYGSEPVQDIQIEIDDRLAERAAETFQVGFMLLVRSIFQPDSQLKP